MKAFQKLQNNANFRGAQLPHGRRQVAAFLSEASHAQPLKCTPRFPAMRWGANLWPLDREERHVNRVNDTYLLTRHYAEQWDMEDGLRPPELSWTVPDTGGETGHPDECLELGKGDTSNSRNEGCPSTVEHIWNPIRAHLTKQGAGPWSPRLSRPEQEELDRAGFTHSLTRNLGSTCHLRGTVSGTTQRGALPSRGLTLGSKETL